MSVLGLVTLFIKDIRELVRLIGRLLNLASIFSEPSFRQECRKHNRLMELIFVRDISKIYLAKSSRYILRLNVLDKR